MRTLSETTAAFRRLTKRADVQVEGRARQLLDEHVRFELIAAAQ
jgi:hypothetical protein